MGLCLLERGDWMEGVVHLGLDGGQRRETWWRQTQGARLLWASRLPTLGWMHAPVCEHQGHCNEKGNPRHSAFWEVIGEA